MLNDPLVEQIDTDSHVSHLLFLLKGIKLELKGKLIIYSLPSGTDVVTNTFMSSYSALHNVLQFDFYRNIFGSIDGTDTRCSSRLAASTADLALSFVEPRSVVGTAQNAVVVP